jgi:hypothetical protein
VSREACPCQGRIGALAEARFRFDWSYWTIELYSQKGNGLHGNDFVMAAKINTYLKCEDRRAVNQDVSRRSPRSGIAAPHSRCSSR